MAYKPDSVECDYSSGIIIADYLMQSTRIAYARKRRTIPIWPCS